MDRREQSSPDVFYKPSLARSESPKIFAAFLEPDPERLVALSTALRWSAAQTCVRLVLGLVSAKISAVYLGPAGVALVAQVGNLIQVAHGSISNGAQTAIVTLTAQRRELGEPTRNLWATALVLVISMAGVYAVVAAASSTAISKRLLSDDQYRPVIILASLVVFAAVTESVVIGAVNGTRRMDVIAKAAIVSTALEVCTYALLVAKFGLWGGLYGISAIYVMKLAATWFVSFGLGAVTPADFRGRIEWRLAANIASFYPMLIANSIALPLSQMLIRDLVISQLGLQDAGYLQAVWRISDVYISIFTTALGMYFIAHYSSVRQPLDRLRLLRRTVIQVVMLTALAASMIFTFRHTFFRVVLSKEFIPATELLPMQLVGDVFKMGTYVMQMSLVADGRNTAYIAAAVGGPVMYVTLAWILLSVWSTQAVPVSYATSHVLTFVVVTLSIALIWSRSKDTRTEQHE